MAATMKLSIRRKIIFAFFLFFLLSSSISFLSYYNDYVLNQKLQILEKKDTLFNTILEARRYEKNYFLYLHYDNLRDAILFVRKGEEKLSNIIERYGDYTLAKNLTEELGRLRRYKAALSDFLTYYEDGTIRNKKDLVSNFPAHQEQVRELGSRITGDMEHMIAQERRHVNLLVEKSRSYQIISLGGILVLSALTALFLVLNVNRPLKAIEEAIHKISQGDYTNIPALSTGDEFESLVVSLNQMITELNRRSEQLVQTKKLASLGTLTSGVAHELNNPLNNISTSVQILLEELEEADLEFKRELLINTEKQIERARDIVKALLEFSRERSFNLRRVRFREVVDNTVKLIKGDLPADVEIQVEVSDQIQGYMDPRRIQQVLLNLILNGVQAMEQGGGVVRIRAMEQKEKGIFCIQVQDTGKGIPEEDLPKIFDPFFTTKDVSANSGQGSSTQSIVDQQGTGLGLSICHGIAKQHGGRIEVRSKLGEGTTFSICLPFAKDDDQRG